MTTCPRCEFDEVTEVVSSDEEWTILSKNAQEYLCHNCGTRFVVIGAAKATG